MSSDTPRTDAALEWVRPAGNDSGPPHEQYVSGDFARELERENNALRAKIAELEQQLHALRLVCGTTDANKFQTVVDRQLAKIAELEQDKARLDWLDGQNGAIVCDGLGGAIHNSVREAIDAARSKELT